MVSFPGYKPVERTWHVHCLTNLWNETIISNLDSEQAWAMYDRAKPLYWEVLIYDGDELIKSSRLS